MALDTCLKHHFLIAMPKPADEPDEYFSKTITYICEHNEEGAMGFMVNRPMKLTVGELLDQLGISGTVSTRTTGARRRSGEDGARFHPAQRRRAIRREPSARQWSDAQHCAPDARGDRYRRRSEALPGRARLRRMGQRPTRKRTARRTSGSRGPADIDILFDVPFDQRVNQAAASLGIDFRLMSTHAGHA